MSAEVGFFQIEEVLLTKVNSSPAKIYVELYNSNAMFECIKNTEIALGLEYDKLSSFSANTIIDGVDYVDLGLPSGTLWSKKPLDFVNYVYLHLSTLQII